MSDLATALDLAFVQPCENDGAAESQPSPHDSAAAAPSSRSWTPCYVKSSNWETS